MKERRKERALWGVCTKFDEIFLETSLRAKMSVQWWLNFNLLKGVKLHWLHEREVSAMEVLEACCKWHFSVNFLNESVDYRTLLTKKFLNAKHKTCICARCKWCDLPARCSQANSFWIFNNIFAIIQAEF